MSKFKKGESGNKNGRPKGAENKEKKELRKSLQTFLDGNLDKFHDELRGLKGIQFIDRYIALLEYCTPKLNRTDLTNDGEKFDTNISTDELITELKQFAKKLGSEEIK
jgi:hypothetical protein